MKNRIHMALLLSLVSLGLCSAGAKESSMMNEKSANVGQVSLKVSIPRECIAGESILCEISMTNAGNKAMSYGHISEWNDFAVEIKDANGTTVPLTRFGKAILAGDSGERKKFNTKNLLPGQALTRRCNLARLFDLSVSGDYTISVTREINEDQGGGRGVLRVENIPLRILD